MQVLRHVSMLRSCLRACIEVTSSPQIQHLLFVVAELLDERSSLRLSKAVEVVRCRCRCQVQVPATSARGTVLTPFFSCVLHSAAERQPSPVVARPAGQSSPPRMCRQVPCSPVQGSPAAHSSPPPVCRQVSLPRDTAPRPAGYSSPPCSPVQGNCSSSRSGSPAKRHLGDANRHHIRAPAKPASTSTWR